VTRTNKKKNATLPAPLKVSEVFLACPTGQFTCKTTHTIKPSNEIIAQSRAVDAIKVGLGISKPGFNIYVAGDHGTGKTSVIKTFLEHYAEHLAPPQDWVYVYDFYRIDVPKEIALPSGQGWQFAKDMEKAIKLLRSEIPAALQSATYENTVNAHLSHNADQQTRKFNALEKRAKKVNFQIKSTKSGIETIPVINGRAITEKEYNKLSEKERLVLEATRSHLEPHVLDFARKVRFLELEAKTFVSQLQRDYTKEVMQQIFEPISRSYAGIKEVATYLDQVKEDILENLFDFIDTDEHLEERGKYPAASPQHNRFYKYKVNLYIDNRLQKSAPIIIENNPTYYNLFGRIEKNIENGMYYTDFTMIKAGAIHRANGGFLVLEAADVFKMPAVWETLKRSLRTSQGFIEDYGEQLSLFPTTGLRPNPIPLDVKVIMIGSDDIYHLLHEMDDEFTKVFKIKADFDYKMPRNKTTINAYTTFLATRCHKEKLLHFSTSGLSAMVEYGSRLVEDKQQLTTQFGELKDITIEADYLARRDKSPTINRSHVEDALQQKFFRVNLIEHHLQEAIKNRDVLLSLDGSCIGQVNGLAVYDIGNYAFGKPVRITCTSAVNEDGIVNIERASKLTGHIHDKGVHILSSYLHALLAREYALGLSASVCFEQSYSIIDGDSASIAELVAIISAMAEIPVKQHIAMTGSLNQLGEVQPIGGINEKIEGFYNCSQLIGKGKKYGVIMPVQNVGNLMLQKETRTAVSKGTLEIFPVKYFWQVFELATGHTLGVKQLTDKQFAKGSALAIIQQKMQKIHEDEQPKDAPHHQHGKV
jgi:lon-related putative ATP-dependent protease